MGLSLLRLANKNVVAGGAAVCVVCGKCKSVRVRACECEVQLDLVL